MTQSITSQDVYDALKRVKMESGQHAVRALLQRVANVKSGSEVRPEDYEAIVEACGPAASIKPDGTIDEKVIFAKWNASGKRAGR